MCRFQIFLFPLAFDSLIIIVSVNLFELILLEFKIPEWRLLSHPCGASELALFIPVKQGLGPLRRALLSFWQDSNR